MVAQKKHTVGLIPGNIVLDRDPVPPKKMSTAAPPLFGPYHCGQTAGWIKMPLGTEIGLSPGHIVLDGDPAPPRKGAQQPPLFAPCLLWPNGRPSQQLLSSFSFNTHCWFVGWLVGWMKF